MRRTPPSSTLYPYTPLFRSLEAADAVGDREERLVAALAHQEHVLVVGADLPCVGCTEGFQEQHSPRAYSSYRKVVEPTRTVSPCLRGVAPTVLRPLTNVPLVDPRSSTYSRPPWRVSWAWRPEV